MTRLGIQISSVRKYLQTPQDVLASFRKVSQIGYRIIQIQWIAPEVPAGFIHEALQETGLECIGTQDYYDEVIGQWDEVVAMNELWGGTYICVSGIPERYQSYEGCLALARDLNQRSERLEQTGKILTFHPRSFDVIHYGGTSIGGANYGGANSLEILREYTRTQVQFTTDVYHIVKAGFNAVDWIYGVQGRNDLVHFKDGKKQADGSETLTPTGQGDIDWAPIFQACEDTGVKYGFAEQEAWQKDPFECLKESYDYLVSHGIASY